MQQLATAAPSQHRLIKIYGVELTVISNMLLGTFRTADGKAHRTPVPINKQECIILRNHRFPYFLAFFIIERRKIIITDDPFISRAPAVDQIGRASCRARDEMAEADGS